MAWIEGRNQFPVLRNTGRFSLLLPDDGRVTGLPVLWLLPIAGGMHSDWVRYTAIERWARSLRLAVVMPEGLRSDFVDMAHGMAWWQYLSQELPAYLRRTFGLDPAPADQAAFGAGMGALGALKLGLRTERFCAVGAVGADLAQFAAYDRSHTHDQESIYGTAPMDTAMRSAHDPFAIVQARADLRGMRVLLEVRDEASQRLFHMLAGRGCHVTPTSAWPEGWEGREAALQCFLRRQYGLRIPEEPGKESVE